VDLVVDVVGYFTGDAGSLPPPPPALPPVPPDVALPDGSPTLNQSVLVNTSQGLNKPWDIAFLPGATGPDGAMLYTENDGKTVDAYISAAEPRRVLLANDDVDTAVEGGMMGIAVHPSYPASPYVYVCFTSLAGNDNRVVRYTLALDASNEPLQLTNPLPIITGILQADGHNGCRLRFQPGSDPPALFVTMGDALTSHSAQDPNGLNGKVLRVDENGNAYPGNPFGKKWYTRGHRNPQGIAFRPGTDQPYSAEHGPNINDEVNALVPGGNAGWEPNTFGAYDQLRPMTDLTKHNVVLPTWRSGDEDTIAPSGLTFLENVGGESWGSWENNIVLAVLKGRELRMLVLDANGAVTGQVQVKKTTQRLRVPVLGPDGKLYVPTDQNPGEILVFDPA
jgi:glucose/arabinose dehydrogenase